jgi:hypothetical protein
MNGHAFLIRTLHRIRWRDKDARVARGQEYDGRTIMAAARAAIGTT